MTDDPDPTPPPMTDDPHPTPPPTTDDPHPTPPPTPVGSPGSSAVTSAPVTQSPGWSPVTASPSSPPSAVTSAPSSPPSPSPPGIPAVPDGPSGAGTGRGNAAETGQVGAMFDRISGVYDVMNAVISGFQEPRWRRRAVREAGLRPGGSAIDVATGTGKVAASLGERVRPTGRVLGVDVAPRMIDRARRTYADRPWLEYVVGDAMALPAADATFDAATIAFGMRNLPDYGIGFAEMRRVVRPGGVVICLEISRPATLVGRLGRIWFERIVPVLGRVAGQGQAYSYLVESVRNYPDPERIAAIMREAGLVDVRWTPMTFGMVTVHVGRRPTG